MEKIGTKNAEKGEEEEDNNNMSIWDCGSPLYDSFELASLCHHLDRHLMTLPFTVAKDSDEFSGKKKIVVPSSGGGRGKKEEIEEKNKVGLKEIYRASIAFLRKYLC
ncbi:uncharacterized protein A4U43_C01F2420 [Asparagus officinalis]|uniref:Uncharacterized protein n=1 Tax=Asparagus officinalis TaxID=4686 RepID=A0A5P1FMT9_ASPOF|nr:uncharacterized protein A4U43_C01F2420 [Asparagus officinalis]